MAKTKITLTDEQKRRNAEILARIAEEEARMFDDTRALQRNWKNNGSRRRSHAQVSAQRE